MNKLSTGTQAVHLAAIDAYWDNDSMCPADPHVIAAAALRAVADQVLPEIELHISVADDCLPRDIGAAKWAARWEARREILAIAAEPEAQP